MDLHLLKSGSDVRGVAIGDGAVLTDRVVKLLGAAYTQYLSERYNLPVSDIAIAIGRDSRLSGSRAFTGGLPRGCIHRRFSV